MLTYEKNLTTGVTREYAYLNNQIIGWQETDNTGNSVKRYATTDLLGSVTTVTDESGTVLWSGEYTAFGNVAYGSGNVLYEGMYTGKDIDSETGLTYHWNRWRNEDGSSFISEDPARDGSNWYGYCGNNPINSTDPTGLVMDYANGGSGTYWGAKEDRPVNDSRVTPDEGPEQGPTEPQKVEVPLPKLLDSFLKLFEINTESITDLAFARFKAERIAELYATKNQELAETLIKFIGTEYELGGYSFDSIDCSGLLGRALVEMGYSIDRDKISTKLLSSGNTDWIGLYPSADNDITGNLGMINFYKTDGSKIINHMNYGIGLSNTPLVLLSPMNQIIDATEGSMISRNYGRPGQYIIAGTHQVNQTYAPFSSNTKVSKQAFINWEVLESKYKE